MQIPTRQELLKQLDRLDDRARRRRMAQLAHHHRDEPDLDVLLDELEAGEVYEQSLAIGAALVAGRQERLLRAFASDSVRLATLGGAVGGIADGRTLEAVLPEVAPAARRRLLAQVVRKRRGDVADRLLPLVLRDFGAGEAARLLHVCSSPAVRRTLPEVAHAIPSWSRLATAHEEAVLDYIRERHGAAPAGAPALWTQVAPALRVLAVGQPHALLDLACELLAEGGLPAALESRLGTLAHRAPEQVAQLLLAPEYRSRLLRGGVPRGVLRHLRRLPSSLPAELARILLEEPGHLAQLLEALPPAQRTAIFHHACDGVDIARREWPAGLLEALPHAVRDAEAQRMLALPSIREDPERTLEITAHRDVDEARPVLEEAASGPRAEQRRRALALLIECTGRCRRGLSETLGFVRRIRNDQDAVRQSVFGALAGLPPTLFTADHTAALRQLVDDTLAGRDTSRLTRSRIQALAHHLLETQATKPDGALFQLALEVLRRTAEHAGSISLPAFHNLPRDAEPEVYAALEPMIRGAAERQDFDLAMSLARTLDKRAWRIDGLQAWLEKATRCKPDWTARAAIELWLADPGARDERVRRLLDRDPSAICVEPVLRHLLQRRQTWLDPYLEGRRIKGRFLTGETIYLLPATSGFHRWLPRQQRSFHALLRRVAGDGGRDLAQRVAAVHAMARLPVVGLDDLEPFLESAEIPIAEAAIGGLAWTDRPAEVLPTLLDHLDGDRARVAMYAVPRCARLTAPRRMEEVLRDLLARERLKVTVHKEAVRLLGGLRGPGSMALLEDAWKRGEQHRDVRVAFGHAARRRLDREEAWEILAVLATDADVEVARSLLGASPTSIATSRRPRYAALLLAVAAHSDAELRRDAFKALVAWVDGAEEPITEAAVDVMTDLESCVVWPAALAALIAAVRNGKSGEALLSLVHALRTAPTPVEHNAGGERDLPARRRLLQTCDRLRTLSAADRERLRATLRQVAGELQEDATLWSAAAALQIATMDWSRPRAAAAILAELAVVADREPCFRHHLVRQVEQALDRDQARWEPVHAEALLGALDATDSLALRHTELAVLRQVARRSQWVEPWLTRLRALRSHPNLGLRSAALDVATREEEASPPRPLRRSGVIWRLGL
ncbi:MAG: hypothetical protein GY856_31945 [bacterium]|nr:hypothetical protein [bacterium]